MDRTLTKIYRWSFLTVVGVVIFWTVFYLKNGYVPTTSVVGFWSNDWVVFKLNFAISRWFDILIGPIWLAVIISWGNSSFWKTEYSPREVVEFFVWLIIFISLFDALAFGIATGIATALLSAMAIAILGGFILILLAIARWANANEN